MSLPGYEILKELGRGGMGVVYEARQVHLNRPVALKMMLAGTHAGPEELTRFRVEAQAVARLDHPNIVRIYDYGEYRGLPYFSMELVTGGGSLGQKMACQPWPVPTAARLIQTLALAMHHAHQQRVIHRDLKPGNVLFHRDGTPKVTDFGLAKQLDSNVELTGTGRILGTARYMAPEQAAGDIRAIGPATDVHALGVMLYELLTGLPAFPGHTFLESLEQVRSREPVSPTLVRPEVPSEVSDLCLRCLRKNPAQRFRSAEELAEELQSLLVGIANPASLPSSVQTESDEDRLDRSQWWRV